MSEDRWKLLENLADANPNAMFGARAVADMLREATGWQPIKTAPKDELALLWSKKWGLQIGCWGNFEKYNQPEYSHWMPLPPAPKEGE